MTSQVAVLNLYGVAVASDSFLTLGQGLDERTIPSMEKIFDLGSQHRVACLISGDARVMGVPWPLVLGEWKKDLPSPLATVHDYTRHLVDWLAQRTDLFASDQVEDYVVVSFGQFLEVVAGRVDELLMEDADSELSATDLEAIGDVAVDACLAGASQSMEYTGIEVDREPDRALIDRLRPKLAAVLADLFEGEVLSSHAQQRVLSEAPLLCLTRAVDWNPRTRVALVGYGHRELYPRIESVEVEAVVEGVTRWCPGLSGGVSPSSDALVQGLAQAEAAMSFIRGIHRSFIVEVFDALAEVLDTIEAQYPEVTENGFEELRPQLFDMMDAAIERHAQDDHIDPVITTIGAMPPLELARMADSLVGIQALRSASANRLPTVGGDIDVAIITLGAGLEWVRRRGATIG